MVGGLGVVHIGDPTFTRRFSYPHPLLCLYTRYTAGPYIFIECHHSIKRSGVPTKDLG